MGHNGKKNDEMFPSCPPEIENRAWLLTHCVEMHCDSMYFLKVGYTLGLIKKETDRQTDTLNNSWVDHRYICESLGLLVCYPTNI